jgi:hypothetical protein
MCERKVIDDILLFGCGEGLLWLLKTMHGMSRGSVTHIASGYLHFGEFTHLTDAIICRAVYLSGNQNAIAFMDPGHPKWPNSRDRSGRAFYYSGVHKEPWFHHTYLPNHECGRCGKVGVVKTKLKKCSRCRVVWYCDVECQKAHWIEHKNGCKVNDKVLDGTA